MTLPDVTALRFADNLRELTKDVDVILSDVWGVIHNGVNGFPPACQALQSFREQGGTVIMITNAPRPADSVQRQLRKMDISDETYDAIVSSGDLTRNYVASHLGQSFLMIGPERDNPMLRGLDVNLTTIDKADTIICTGPYNDEVETEEDYRTMMEEAQARPHFHLRQSGHRGRARPSPHHLRRRHCGTVSQHWRRGHFLRQAAPADL